MFFISCFVSHPAFLGRMGLSNKAQVLFEVAHFINKKAAEHLAVKMGWICWHTQRLQCMRCVMLFIFRTPLILRFWHWGKKRLINL